MRARAVLPQTSPNEGFWGWPSLLVARFSARVMKEGASAQPAKTILCFV